MMENSFVRSNVAGSSLREFLFGNLLCLVAVYSAPLLTGFLCGAATAASKIEGSPLADGAAVSIWYRFSHTPGRVFNRDTADIACDHYRRWREDLELKLERNRS